MWKNKRWSSTIDNDIIHFTIKSLWRNQIHSALLSIQLIRIMHNIYKIRGSNSDKKKLYRFVDGYRHDMTWQKIQFDVSLGYETFKRLIEPKSMLDGCKQFGVVFRLVFFLLYPTLSTSTFIQKSSHCPSSLLIDIWFADKCFKETN